MSKIKITFKNPEYRPFVIVSGHSACEFPIRSRHGNRPWAHLTAGELVDGTLPQHPDQELQMFWCNAWESFTFVRIHEAEVTVSFKLKGPTGGQTQAAITGAVRDVLFNAAEKLSADLCDLSIDTHIE